MTINGYSYSNKFGAILDSTGKAIGDKHFYVDAESYELLKKVALSFFFDALKVDAGFDVDALTEHQVKIAKYKADYPDEKVEFEVDYDLQ